METRASYVLVGVFVLALIVAGFGFALWMARVGFEEAPSRYLAYFTDDVTGLAVGSVVQYRGVPVGSVSDIRIDPKNVERIRVLLEVEPGTPIVADTTATLGIQGITGVAFVQLKGGTQGAAALKPPPGERYPVIPTRPSGLAKVLSDAPVLLENAVVISQRLEALLSPENIERVSATLAHVEKLTSAVAEPAGGVDEIIAETKATVVELRNTAKNISDMTAELTRNVEPLAYGAQDVMTDVQVTLTDLRGSAETFRNFAKNLNATLAENRAGLRDFSGGGLYELTQFVVEARQLVATLSRLSSEIERDPARFFFGDTQKGFEPP